MLKRHSSWLRALATAWLSAVVAATLVAADAGFEEDTGWRYFKGVREASEPEPTAWREPEFVDAGWAAGPAPFFYEDKAAGYTGNTRLADMRGGYLTLFLRKGFEVLTPDSVRRLTLELRVDDGCIVWLNGREVARVNMPDGEVPFDIPALSADNNPNVFGVTLDNAPGLLRGGVNVLAVQAANISLADSSDFLFAARLALEVDDQALLVEAVFPEPGSVLRALSSLEVVFNRNVTGVDAADLQVNNQPAASLEVHSPRNYTFRFPEPSEGLVTIAWAPDHGITDTSPEPVPFAGGGWSYTLDRQAPPPQVIISEFLADNQSGPRDQDADRSDWIELRNLGAEPVALGGWFLTDDPARPTQWRFPEVTLNAGAYRLVWASGKDRADPARELHTNFRLANAGEYLALLDARTNVVSEFAPTYPPQRADISFGRDLLDPQRVGYFAKPTPGAPNIPGGSGFATDPVFSVPGGLYVTNQMVIEITAPSGHIYYSTDGRPPVPAVNGVLYTGPLTLSGSTVLLARVYEDDLLPSRVVAECYQFAAPSLAGFSSNLPLLIIQPARGGIAFDSSARTPVFVTAVEPFRGRATLRDKPAHRGLGGMNIRGQSSAGFPKKQYRLELTDAAGLDQNIPLLGLPAEADWVLNGPYSDKSLINNFLTFELHEQMGHYAVRRRLVEVFLDETRGALTYPSDYRGVYVLLEKIEIDRNRMNLARMGPGVTQEPEITGGYIFKKDKDSPGDRNFSTRGGAGFGAQLLKYHDPKPDEITSAQQVWLRNHVIAFENALYAGDWLTRTGSQHYSAFIDVASFVDNHWIVEFTKQIDGYRLSNYLHKDRGGKIGMDPIWDWNLSLGNADYLEGWNPAGWYWPLLGASDHLWLRRLITGTPAANTRTGDPDFNQAIVDRWSVLRTNILNPTNVLARVDELAAYLDEAKDRDFARWPRLNTYVWPNPAIYIQPTYAQIIANKKKWIQDRFNWIDRQFPRAPLFSHPGGRVAAGFTLTISAPAGEIYYTTSGADPRAPGGGLRAEAVRYTGPIQLAANARVVARARQSGNWSGPTAVTFVTATPPLRVSELMYHPAPTPGVPEGGEDPNDFEFIELVNLGSQPLALTGFRFTQGIQFDFSTGAVTSLAPGARVLVVQNRAAFERRYGTGLSVAGEYTGRLDNAGEALRLLGPVDEAVQEFRYDNRWHPATDGVGFALAPADLNAPPAVWSAAAGWRPGSVLNGTPGMAEPTAPRLPAILVNEVLANPDAGQRDTIELFNPTAGMADISGWFLSDDRRVPKHALPAGSVLPPGGFLVIDADQFNRPGGVGSFGLSAAGEEVFLFSADAAGRLSGYAHGFTFGAAPPGVTVGRLVTSAGEEHFVLQAEPSLGAANVGPHVGPVVISEVMYHPPDVFANGAFWDAPEDEYLELLNLTDQPVPLFDPAAPTNTWQLCGAARFQFPTNLILAPAERLLIVGFDPAADAAQAAAFRGKYSLAAEVRLLGPWQGKLNNRGETLELIQPLPLGGDETAAFADLVVDRVEYRDEAPWPAGADGLGFALQRRPEQACGNDPAHWLAAAPTPGKPPAAGALPEILSQPVGLATLAGRGMMLSVLARNPAAVRYQWRKDGQPLPGATNAALNLANVQLAQAGAYDVLVFNETGAVASAPAAVRVALPGADTDGDGLSDLYELTHGLDPAWPDDLDADPDGDGLSTREEHIAGTNPLDPKSRLGFTHLEWGAAGVKLRFAAASDRLYSVEYRDRLEADEPWRLLTSVPVVDNGSAALRTVTVTDATSPAPPARYYRLRAGQP
jgi:hypothetical protein